MNNNYLSNQLISSSIHLNPNELNSDINNLLVNKLREKYEQKCINEGYIVKDSIELVNKSLGFIKSINNESKIVYNLKFSADILFPIENDVIEGYIDNHNKMGVIAYIKLSDSYKNYKGANNITDSPFIIIIPNNDSIDKSEIKINEKKEIKVKATRIKYNSKNIQVIGEFV